MAFPSWLRHCAAMVLVVGLLGLAFGCKKSSKSSYYNIGGTVTYTRLPVACDGNGSPTGLGSVGTAMPARGVVVRAFQLWNAVASDGSTTYTWRLAGTAVTDSNGAYAMDNILYSGNSTFVEVDSIFQQAGDHQSQVRLIADPNGITSTLTEPRRPVYALRQDVAGTSFTDPTPGVNAVATVGGDATVNFAVGNGTGAGDTWAVTDYDWYMPGLNATAPRTTQAIGSRVLAILDSAYYFCSYYGDPTPSAIKGGFLDLHYYPGVTAPASPLRDYVVYDPTTTPLAVDGNGLYHYFGTLSGSAALDDAFDPGAIYPLLARNNLFGQRKTNLFPTGLNGKASPSSLSPDLALVDGLADAMAATLLQRPFVTDLTASTALAPWDIRTIPANPGMASPASLASLAWQLTLDAQALVDIPSQWALISPNTLKRFFTLIYPTIGSGTATVQNDISSGWVQLARLQEGKGGGEPVDLQACFYDTNLILYTLPYGIAWTNAAYADSNLYAANWGVNPDSNAAALPALTLSMANVQQVQQQNFATGTVSNVYPNCSKGEVVYAKLALTLDRSYALSISPAPPAGAAVEVVVDGNTAGAYTFTSTAAQYLTLLGNPPDSTTPAWHFLRFRLLSPTVKQADYAVTVNLSRLD